jgi:hypothetical protein
MNYLVVLFKNKERKKIINKFKTLKNAQDFFDKKIDASSKVIFGKEIENASDCFFELALLKRRDDNFETMFVRDDYGRQVKIETDDPDYKIIKISKYLVEEKIFDISKNKKISVNDFIKTYLPKNSIKLISSLNNKIIVQNDNLINLFSLKNEMESKRFLDSLSDYFQKEGRIDSIIVSESSKEQKKYLYDLLCSSGIDKQTLYRRSTTFKKRN